MNPYYQEENITIYNGDCLEVMKEFEDNQFDLCLTDPPYGVNIAAVGTIGASNLASVTDYGVTQWDKDRIPKEYFNYILKITKNQIIFGGNYYTDYLVPSSQWLIWDKRVDDKYSNNFADCELMWTSFQKSSGIYRWLWSGMIQQNARLKDKRVHPTQKPLGLIKKIIQDYSKEGDTIFDPFLGSGTTARACKDLGRKCIGIEISQEYCDIAVKRLGQEVLF